MPLGASLGISNRAIERSGEIDARGRPALLFGVAAHPVDDFGNAKRFALGARERFFENGVVFRFRVLVIRSFRRASVHELLKPQANDRHVVSNGADRLLQLMGDHRAELAHGPHALERRNALAHARFACFELALRGHGAAQRCGALLHQHGESDFREHEEGRCAENREDFPLEAPPDVCRPPAREVGPGADPQLAKERLNAAQIARPSPGVAVRLRWAREEREREAARNFRIRPGKNACDEVRIERG